MFALSACGGGASSPAPSSPPPTSPTPEEKWEQAGEIAESLNEAAATGEYYTPENGLPTTEPMPEPQPSEEPQPPFDLTRAPRADQIIQLRQYETPLDEYREKVYAGTVLGYDMYYPAMVEAPDPLPNVETEESLWKKISTTFRAGYWYKFTHELKADKWDSSTALDNVRDILFSTLHPINGPTNRHPDRKAVYQIDDMFFLGVGFLINLKSNIEIRDYYHLTPIFHRSEEAYADYILIRNLADWQAFVDEEHQRLGFVRFLNGVTAPATDAELSKSNYVMIWISVDGDGNSTFHIPSF
jgi:hypothetical protein